MALRAAFVGVLLAFIACNSPTLPLPPPALPTITTSSEPNTFHLKSDRGVIPNALVIILNRNETLTRDQRVSGTIADSEGTWEADVFGHVGDVIDIQQEDKGTLSPQTTATLK